MSTPVQQFNALLDKWLSGAFRRSDDSAMQSLKQSDDFARESMEGYQSMPEENHRDSLDRLRQQLQERSGSGMVAEKGGLSSSAKMAMAASFALLLGAFWFFQNRLSSADSKASVAQSAPATPPAQEPDGETAAPTTAPTTAAESEMAAQSSPSKRSAGGEAPNDRPTTSADRFTKAPTESAKMADKAVTAPPPAPQPVLAESTEELQDLVVADGMAKKEMKDTKMQAPSAPEKAKAKKALKQTDTVKHKTDDQPIMPAKDAALADDSAPTSGWDNYYEYLRQNARLTEEARNKNISGSVTVQFTIDDFGQPKGFVFKKTLGYGCDEEAVRLIKEGSEWEPGKKRVVTLDIKFIK